MIFLVYLYIRFTYNNLDTEIFTLLKQQAIEVFIFLLVTRDFASGKGLQNEVEKINEAIAENISILALTNHQLSDLTDDTADDRLGIFDTI
jgi:hypothetical protein